MPPARRATKKAPAPPPSPLDGCTIAVAGTFPGVSQASIKERIKNLGGNVTSSAEHDIDYLIATQTAYDKKPALVKAATENSRPIVSIDWLLECETSASKVDTMKYLLSSPAPASSQQQPNGGTSKSAKSKRPASPDPASPTPPPQPTKKQKKLEAAVADAKIGDGQNAKSGKLHIPLDEYCPNSNYQVYVGDDGTIYDASLNQTNASANNNKFYRIQLIRHPAQDHFLTWTRWGRVGEGGQHQMLGSGSLKEAVSQFEKKFKAKSGLSWTARGENPKPGKYAYIERNYNPDSESEDEDAADPSAAGDDAAARAPAKCTLERPVRELMELIFNQQYFAQAMTDLNYDANKLPLGKLSKATINRGFQALKDLAALLQDPGLAQTIYGQPLATAIEQLSNSYYSLIPHAFGRNRPPIIRTNDLLKKEIELLESLGDMKEAAALMKSNLKDDGGIHPLDRQFQGLGMDEMEPVDRGSAEFTELFEYLNNSKGSTHNHQYRVQDIFRIQRHGELDRFEQSQFSKVASNRRLLWHGSRVTNFGGILGQGLRIAPPEAPVSGYMFGKGIYLADMSSKSANYCCSHSSGGTALLLLCEAELGTPMQELLYASYNAGEDAKAKGMYSTWGKGSIGPSKWKDAKCVHPSLAGVMMPDVSTPPGPTNANGSLWYNEYICYDVAQVRLRYLLRISM